MKELQTIYSDETNAELYRLRVPVVGKKLSRLILPSPLLDNIRVMVIGG